MFSLLPKNRLYRHLLFWLVVALYFLIPQSIYPDYIDTVTHYYFNFDYQHSPYFLFIVFLYVFGVGILYAYAFVRWALPPLLEGRYGLGIGLYLLLTIAICYLSRTIKGLHMAVIDPFLRGMPSRPFDGHHFDDYFFNQVYIHEYSTIILVLAAYKFFTNWLQKQQETNRLDREKISTEIQLLKTQINPDFLFSSLDQLRTLTLQKSKQAPKVVLKLAHLLRYVLYESLSDTVPLEREIDVIGQFVFLQQIMHPTEMEVSSTIRGNLGHQVIAPLTLFPIVEHAFSQLSAEVDEPSWVSIDLAVSETHLTLKVINGQVAIQTDGSKQLADIQKQLYFHYADRHHFQVWQEDQINVITLTISFPTNSLTPLSVSRHVINSIA